MASGAAAKRAQGERAAGRQPRPRPRPQRGADRVPPRLVPQRRTLDRGCCAPSRRRYRKLPVRNPSFQGLGRIDGGDKNAEEDSITRLSDKPGPDDSWPTSPSQGLDFGTKVKQIMEEAATRKFVHEDGSHIISFCVSGNGGRAVSPFSRSWPRGEARARSPGQPSASSRWLEALPMGAHAVTWEPTAVRLSDKPGPGDSWPTSASQDVDFGTKEGTAKSAMEAKEDGVGIIENVPPEQTVNDSVTSAGGVHKNCRSDMMSALELGEEEDVESPSLPELQEAQDRHAEAIRHAEEMKDHMQK